jgi:hypothetical protein
MGEHDEWLAERFEEHRARLRAVAYWMLGSTSEAEDAVQEAWLRLAALLCVHELVAGSVPRGERGASRAEPSDEAPYTDGAHS